MPQKDQFDREGGVQLSWQNIIMTVGLVLTMVGGFWYLAYIPIQRTFDDMKAQISELRNMQVALRNDDEAKYLTQKEHQEFKSNVHAADARIDVEMANLRKEIVTVRSEAATRSDMQQALNTTRVEFLAEIKRLNDLMADDMKRKEFDAWKMERDKVIALMQDRQSRFSEALDSMYSKLMTQMPFFKQNQQQ